WPRRPHQRAEIAGAQGEVVEEAVVERQVSLKVVAHAVDAVRGVEAIHLSGVVLAVRGIPPVADVRRGEAGEVEGLDRAAISVRLRVSAGHAVAADERGEAE